MHAMTEIDRTKETRIMARINDDGSVDLALRDNQELKPENEGIPFVPISVMHVSSNGMAILELLRRQLRERKEQILKSCSHKRANGEDAVLHGIDTSWCVFCGSFVGE